MVCQHCSRKVSFAGRFEVPKLPSDPVVKGLGGRDGFEVFCSSVGFVGFSSRFWLNLQSTFSLSTVSTVFDGKDCVGGVNNRIRSTVSGIFLL